MSPNSPAATARKADLGAVLLALVLPSLVTWVYFVALRGAAASLQQGVYGAGKIIQFGFPIFWVLVVQRRRLRLKWPRAAGVIEGLAFAVLVLLSMWLLYHGWLRASSQFGPAEMAVRQKMVSFGIDTASKYMALAVFYSLGHSFLEEYYYRWFVFGQLRRFVSPALAILVSSLGFMAHHVIVLGLYFGYLSWPTVFFSLATAAGGAVWAWIYYRSDSLLGPWLSHLMVDAAIFVIGYGMVHNLFVGC